MRRVSVLLLCLAALPAYAASLALLEGRVTTDQQPLPGCTVRLGAGERMRVAVSDAGGHYAFDNVAEGEQEISFELEGLQAEQQRVFVRGERFEVPAQELRVSAVETVVISCNFGCSDDLPVGRYDRPRCSDSALHDSLAAAAERGDASSVALLRSRYASELSESERNRLGGMLLGKIPDDSAIWNELAGRAEVPIRFRTERSPVNRRPMPSGARSTASTTRPGIGTWPSTP